MRFAYTTHSQPAAPVVPIWIGPPYASLRVGPLQAYVDTGADGTIVPIRHLAPLTLVLADRSLLRSQWGERRLVKTYWLDIAIGEFKLPSIQVVGDEQGDEIILGRNLLNKFVLTLNGPQRLLEILV